MVIILVEEFEFEKIGSKSLKDVYTECGVTNVCHSPIVDFHLPSLEAEGANIELLTTSLTKGLNCLVHCWYVV